jgi:hypothetical protein
MAKPIPSPESSTPEGLSHDDGQGDSPSLPKIPLTRWAIGAISAIVVAYSAITYGTAGYTEVKNTIAAHRDASAYTNAITQEMTRHEHDDTGVRTTLHGDSLGETVAVYYGSDGCIAISRPGAAPSAYLPSSSNYEWSLGPSRRTTGNVQKSAQGINVGQENLEPSPAALADAAAHSPTLGFGHLRVNSAGLPQIPVQQVQVGCLNPHPGNWQGSWGPANGCWAPFYRHFNDGCTHYQMYNACQGVWDQQIHWTYCNSNHHP